MRVDRLYASNGGVTQTIFAPLIFYSHFVTLIWSLISFLLFPVIYL